jgi:tetratricopeptide (TPR) repeat protein
MTVDRWTGREARLLRQALRLSVRGFAEYLGVSVRTVSRWEQHGAERVPRPEFQAVLDTALRQAGTEGQQRFQLATSAAENATASVVAPDRSEGVESDADVELAPVVNLDTFRHWSSRTIGVGELDDLLTHLGDQWHLLVKTDNLFGPRYALRGVLDQLRLIEDLLLAVSEGGRVEVIRLGAQYAESAAWLYEDSGNLETARAWNSRAMAWAHEAGDHLMLAWTLFRRSQQAIPTGNGGEVVGLARAAARDAELPTVMRAAITQQIAYGLALQGNEIEAHRQLDLAHAWAAVDVTGDARTGHGSFCTDSYIELQRANCWLTLGQPHQAIERYDEVLPTLPPVYRRDRGRALSRLAQAHVAAGHPDQAAEVASEALTIAHTTGSARTVEDVAAVALRLQPHRQLPAVAQLITDVAASRA